MSHLPDGQSEKIVLQHVLHQPGSFNLISQSTIMDKDVRVELVNHYGLNLYNQHGKLIATAPQVGGLFVLDHVMELKESMTVTVEIAGVAAAAVAEVATESCMVALKTIGHLTQLAAAGHILWHR